MQRSHQCLRVAAALAAGAGSPGSGRRAVWRGDLADGRVSGLVKDAMAFGGCITACAGAECFAWA